MSEYCKPIFRWAGSKKKLLPILIKNLPASYNRYIEPFCGSACLFFAIKPIDAILGDINSELITTYDVIRKYPYEVARLASEIPSDKDTYLKIRSQPIHNIDFLKKAARFVYLNRYCFNGVYRTNLKGEFNVPMGSKTGGIPPESRFMECASALNSAELYAGDFQALSGGLKEGDFLYMDPPYSKQNKKHGGEYGPVSFQYSDVSRLILFLHEAEQVGVNFILSYSNDPEFVSVVPDRWAIKEINVKRHVSGFSKYRIDASEVLISNNPILI